MVWQALAGAGAQAVLGAIGSKQAADAQEEAAKRAQYANQRGYYGNVALQEPWRQAGYNALSTIGGMYGWQPAPYATAQDLVTSNTPITTKQVAKMLKQGVPLSQISQMGTLQGLNPKAIKRLTKAGLTPEQMQGLTASRVAPAGAPTMAPGGAAPAGAGGAPGAPDDRFGAFFNSPDFLLRKQMAEEAIQRTAAAGSGALNPATQIAVGQRVGAMQGEEYGNWFNRLMTIANGGQQAATNVGGATSQYAGQTGQNAQAVGDARASGVLGVTNSLGAGAGAIGNYYAMQDYLKGMPQQYPGTPPYSPVGPYSQQQGGYRGLPKMPWEQ
jgi:hypothetical protein